MTTPTRILLACALSTVAWAGGCDRSASTSAPATTTTGGAAAAATTADATDPRIAPLPTVEVILGGRRFQLEVADEFEERQKGLMYRRSMPADRGMLFVFDQAEPQAFWMKNTYIPLDIAFLSADGTVLNVAPMFPQELNEVPSAGPAKYAIELNRGIAQKIGLKAGDKVELPAGVR